MVESIYFLKPAWCGSHLAGLWPEQGLQPVTWSHRLQAVVCHYFGVPASVHQALLHAPSKGSYFNQAIRGKFPYSRISHGQAEAPEQDRAAECGR